MEVKGTLVKKLAVESGISKSEKTWQKQVCIIDTGGDFNNEVAVGAFGDKLKDLNKLEVGDIVSIKCNVYSREFKGKYYHNIDGYWFAKQSNIDAMITVSTTRPSIDENVPF